MYHMEVNDKWPYEAPAVEVVEVNTEGIICESGNRDGYGNPNEI